MGGSQAVGVVFVRGVYPGMTVISDEDRAVRVMTAGSAIPLFLHEKISLTF
jgi:hypothetical protein